MRTAPYSAFGRTLDVELVTYTDAKKDETPAHAWDHTLWVERQEDWYALLAFPQGTTVRVVEREMWLRARP